MRAPRSDYQPDRFQEAGHGACEGECQGLARFLGKDFEGSTLQQPQEIRLPGTYIHAVREEQTPGIAPKKLSADAFVEELLKYRREFGKEPQVKIALMTLSPETQGDLDSAYWEGSAVLRIFGESLAKGPVEITLNLKYRLPNPTDEVISGIGWLQTCAITQTLVTKAPQFLLREVGKERGIDRDRFHDNWHVKNKKEIMTQTGGVYLCDYDRDGILDMLVTDINGVFLYKGLSGGRFRDVTAEVGLLFPNEEYRKGPFAFADLDGDGWDDLIFGERIFQNQPDGQGGRRFVDVTHKSNIELRGVKRLVVADFDRDGRLDIYGTSGGTPKTGSWLTGKIGDGTTNRLFRNEGNWQFKEVTRTSGTGGGNRSTFSAVWLDANNDRWPDLYVINEFGNGVLLVNNGDGTFREQMIMKGPSDFGTMGVTAGDVNNDGKIDLYLANMYSKAGSRVIGNLRPDAFPKDVMDTMRRFVTGSQLWLNQGVNEGEVKFEPKGKDWQVAAVGWAYGAALVDLDNDGFLDLYATAGFISQDRNEPDG